MLPLEMQKNIVEILNKIPKGTMVVYFPPEYNFSEADKQRLLGKIIIMAIKHMMWQESQLQNTLLTDGMPADYPTAYPFINKDNFAHKSKQDFPRVLLDDDDYKKLSEATKLITHLVD